MTRGSQRRRGRQQPPEQVATPDRKDMFDSVNAVFLDEIIGARMNIEFSHNPVGDKATLGDEFAYLGADNPIGSYEWLPNEGMNGRMEPMW